ncbi:MBL fold metallo-hydrolase [Yersinia mollaretii]|uniref:Ribonuclease Z n=1 Tax=Yersinia mollaretii TaxID=33060 RepID=A0AA36LQH6_YERMO|nr:MBL fold metallo-hydrolase [Yersinia mollaretii]CNI70253.1 ribonuclease Z [Yersinia mollaretii]
MKVEFKKVAVLMSALFLSSSLYAENLQCDNKDFTLQLLGSGGPISDDQRSSSGEIIWWKGKAAILIDTGSGVFLRFGQSGARMEDLKLIALSHFHTDHTTDLPALLKGAYFFSQSSRIDLVGPMSGGVFPSATQFFDRLFNHEKGAYAYLSGLYDATDGLQLAVNVKDIDYRAPKAVTVYQDDELKVTALGIPHGDVPCLAFRVESAKGVIVVSADQNGSRKEFIDFAKGADILVMPTAIDENADATSKYLHASPSVVGKIAAEVNPGILVLNHFMGKGLKMKDESIDIIKKYYKGDVYSGRDLSCFPINLVKDKKVAQ